MNKKMTFYTVFLFSIILFPLTANAARHGRKLPSPQVIMPNATLKPNQDGGHNYYIDGHMVGKTVLNQSGSYDVYIKGRMKYKGMTFGNSGNTEFKEVNRSGLDYKKEGRESARSPQRQLEDRNVPRGIGNSKVYRNSNGKPIDYYNDGHYYGSGTQIRGQQLREQNKAWSAKRAQSPKGQNFWEGW